ncbi:MAG: tRNA (guanosine(37)-N1)-methyltransferase TrmD [Betaproteobacteria bacterium]|nr:MAG: tRNA (guanosine(37)-N1)-methyltransferase TrmD [Betaproteobacteria bacterium]
MRIEVVTLFPQLVQDASRYGVIGRALERGLWSLECHNPRDFAQDAHRTVDDRPYGGGPGMVMLAEPLEKAIAAARAAVAAAGIHSPRVICLSAQGERLGHRRVVELANEAALILVAGRYEGIDERVVERNRDIELAVGDFVVSGGELPALLLIDAVVRQRPGVLNDARSNVEESFVEGRLDCPQYTRPEIHAGHAVPSVLLSGDHAAIARWRRKQALARTWLRRPDLIAARPLSEEESQLLEEFRSEQHEAKIMPSFASVTCESKETTQ